VGLACLPAANRRHFRDVKQLRYGWPTAQPGGQAPAGAPEPPVESARSAGGVINRLFDHTAFAAPVVWPNPIT
jgi:hypothetical protein